VADGHAEPERDGEDEDVARAPEGPERADVDGGAVGVLGDAVARPVERVVALSREELLDGVDSL
jgi:hypothetical protein